VKDAPESFGSWGDGRKRAPRRWLQAPAIVGVIAALGLALQACGAGANAPIAGRGRLLVELDSSVAPSLDPDGAESADNAMHQAFVNLMDGLVGNAVTFAHGVLVPHYAEGAGGFVPQLATSWTHHGDTWIFNLRRDVVGCTGDHFSSKDVLYTFARGKSVSGAAADVDFLLSTSGILTGAESQKGASPGSKKLTAMEVKALGPYKVQITQVRRSPLLLPVLTTFGTRIFDSAAMRRHATATDPWSHGYTNTTNAPGFGPYCLARWNKGSEMDFSANPHYWKGAPQYSKVVVRAVPADSNRASAISTGQANVATSLTPRENALVAASASGSVLGFQNNVELSLGVNFRYAPFNNLVRGRLIRQAMAYVMPYAQVIKQDYLGLAMKADGLAPPNSFGYTPITTYSTNLARAKQLMSEAGYPDGHGLSESSPAFTVYWTAEESTLLQPIANQIRTSLAQIGINIKLDPIPQAQESERELVTHDMGMFLRSDLRPFVPDIGYDALLFDVSTAAGGLVNSTNFSNAQLDALYQQSEEANGSERLALLAKLQRLEMVDLPLIPLVVARSNLAVSKGITNWLGNSNDNVYWWYLKATP
jgi:peptide/nickel transport system substrate-binding protein